MAQLADSEILLVEFQLLLYAVNPLAWTQPPAPLGLNNILFLERHIAKEGRDELASSYSCKLDPSFSMKIKRDRRRMCQDLQCLVVMLILKRVSIIFILNKYVSDSNFRRLKKVSVKMKTGRQLLL